MALKKNHDIFRNGDTQFHPEDEVHHIPATRPTPEFLNSLQEEILQVITECHFQPQNQPQLAHALDRLKYGLFERNPKFFESPDTQPALIRVPLESIIKQFENS